MEKIGLIGVGIMGQPMALNLLNAGFGVVVHNRSPHRLKAVIDAGGVAAAGPTEVARQCDVVITMLPDSPDVESVVMGASGLLEAMRAGQLFIDMSTIAPETSRRLAGVLAGKGVESLDAPVSGGEVGAKNATLSIMVGGSKAAFEQRCRSFRHWGKISCISARPAQGRWPRRATR